MKYFFFDVDGTLTNIKTGEFIQSGLDTIKKLEEKGNFVAIATGEHITRRYLPPEKLVSTTSSPTAVLL